MSPSSAEIRQRVLASPLFDPAETQRIYHKFFARPSRTNRILVEQYGLGQKRVLELGMAYGQGVIHFGAGSVGLDINPKYVAFAQSIGLEAQVSNVEDGLPTFEHPFEALLCANLLEHIVAPHLLLMRFRPLLAADGLLCIKVPVTPPAWVAKLYRRVAVPLWNIDHDFDYSEHINFFTFRTLAWTLERAGYEVIGQHSPLIGAGRLANALLPWATWLVPSTLTVARKIEAFQYAPERGAGLNPTYAPDLLPYYRGEGYSGH